MGRAGGGGRRVRSEDASPDQSSPTWRFQFEPLAPHQDGPTCFSAGSTISQQNRLWWAGLADWLAGYKGWLGNSKLIRSRAVKWFLIISISISYHTITLYISCDIRIRNIKTILGQLAELMSYQVNIDINTHAGSSQWQDWFWRSVYIIVCLA